MNLFDKSSIKGMFNVDDFHILRMERYSYSGIPIISNKTSNEYHNTTKFYLFDYYDSLSVLYKNNNNTIDYTDCFGINHFVIEQSTTPPSIATQLLSLVKYTELQYLDNYTSTKDPFLSNDKIIEKNCLPFLAMVFVNVTNIKYISKKNDTSIDHDSTYIFECIKEITQLTKLILNNLYLNKPNKPFFTVYQTVNTSDLCIVIRTSNVSDPYVITDIITQAHNNRSNNYLNGIVYSTFTIIGIDINVSTKVLLKAIKSHSDNNQVVLRLQINNDRDKDHIIKQYKDVLIDNNAYGLYGRYNFSIQIPLKEFVYIFPHLLKLKFHKTLNQSELKDDVECYDYVMKLINDINLNNIIVINERILVDLKSAIVDLSDTNIYNTKLLSNSIFQDDNQIYSNINNSRDAKQEIIIQQLLNKQYFHIKKISSYESFLPYLRYEYKEAVRQLYELHRTYAELWYQQDTRINGNIFFIQMYFIIKNIENTVIELQRIFSEHKNTMDSDIISVNYSENNLAGETNSNLISIIKNLITSIRISVDSLNVFHKLLQTVNQQTIQAPNYEILTKVDTEKYIIAYYEFLRLICREHTKIYNKNLIVPIFVTDLLSDTTIIATSLFEKTNLNKSDDNINSIFKYLPTIVSIKTPNIESFARTFETIPQICHEISHALQFCNNNTQISTVLCILSEYLANNITWTIFEHNNIIYDVNDYIYLLYFKNIKKVLLSIFLPEKHNKDSNINNEKPSYIFLNALKKSIDIDKFGNNIMPIFREKIIIFLSEIFSNSSIEVYSRATTFSSNISSVNKILISLKYIYKIIKYYNNISCELDSFKEVFKNSRFLNSFNTDQDLANDIIEINQKTIISIDEYINGNSDLCIHSGYSDKYNTCIMDAAILAVPLALRIIVAQYIIRIRNSIVISSYRNKDIDYLFPKTFNAINNIPEILINYIENDYTFTEQDIIRFINPVINGAKEDINRFSQEEITKTMYLELSAAFNIMNEDIHNI